MGGMKRRKQVRKKVSQLTGGLNETNIKLDVPITKGVAHPTLNPAKVFKKLSRK